MGKSKAGETGKKKSYTYKNTGCINKNVLINKAAFWNNERYINSKLEGYYKAQGLVITRLRSLVYLGGTRARTHPWAQRAEW